MYKLIILPSAARFLKELKEKPLKSAFQKTIDEIILTPYVGDTKAWDLSDIYCFDILYNKIEYEIAYTIIEENGGKVVVILAGTRENIYNELKRYMKDFDK